jgi:hypothetical protein
VLTFDRSEADGEHLLLELAVGEVQRVPHARLVAPRVLLHLRGCRHCTHGQTQSKTLESIPVDLDRNRDRTIPRKKLQLVTKMVGADLEGLGLAHDEADLGGLLVLQQLHGARPALLPLAPVLVEAVQLRLPAATPTVSDQNLAEPDREESKARRRLTCRGARPPPPRRW